MDAVKAQIDAAWSNRTSLTEADLEALSPTIFSVLSRIDNGEIRVAEYNERKWVVHQWIKMAILLSFRIFQNREIWGAPRMEVDENCWFDKIPLKTAKWNKAKYEEAGFRAVPGSIIRYGSFISKNVVLMPCFINIGSYVGEGTMIDTWSTIGSCAQIGKNCHISGGVGIGGVLEPLQANPTIIEDDCFIGARSEIAEGVVVEKGSVISMGVYLGASTKIVNRVSGEIMYGRVPPYSVIVPGTFPGKSSLEPSLACAVIVKQVDEKTRAKTSVNELLRA